MTQRIQISVPDIGGYDDVPVIEVLVAVGDSVAKDQGLVTLESDKATMEVPASDAGVVRELKVAVGDKVSQGDLIAIMEGAPAAGEAAAATAPEPATASADATATAAAVVSKNAEEPASAGAPAAASAPVPVPAPPPATAAPNTKAPPTPSASSATPVPEASPKAAAETGRKADIECGLVVIGAGPGGYTAAFRAADLGLDTVLIERYPQLGGVCLNVGCIPSKALLHAAAVIDEAAHAKDYGVDFGTPKITLDTLRGYKEKVVGQLTKGLAGMAKQRKVRVVQGAARFLSPNELEVSTTSGANENTDKPQLLRFEHCVIAAGSQPVKLPGFPWDDPRLMDSTDALQLEAIPKTLLVVGGGIIGLEMATVFRALGSDVTLVELADQLMSGADADLVKPLADRLKKQGVAVHLQTKVASATAGQAGIACVFEGASQPATAVFDRVLVAVGRASNGATLDADKAGVVVDARGFIAADTQMRSNVQHIFAIGDLVGQPMLAHKATHEGKLAAEVAAGHKREWVARVIPSVAYTDPEIAWVGVTETEAARSGLDIGVAKFPWAASGRAIGLGRTEGFTKLIFDSASRQVIGGGITGPHAGELISEVALAIEMGCEAADIGHTIHPHPTLSESVAMAAEIFEGSITDLYIPKSDKGRPDKGRPDKAKPDTVRRDKA